MGINIDKLAGNQLIFRAVLAVVLVVVLGVVSQYNFFLFHTLVEGFSILVAGCIYVLATKTHKYSGNDFLFFIGTAYLFIAAVDFVHSLTYAGVLFGNCSNLPTQLWIFARYMEASALLVAPYFVVHKLKLLWAPGLVYSVLAVGGISLVLSGVFPRCFVLGEGLTLFKVVSEYIICILVAGSMVYLYKQRKKMNVTLFHTMLASAIFTVAAELCFTLYNDVYGIMNMAGHLFKIVSFMLIYWGIVLYGLEYPFHLVFEKMQSALKKLEENTLKDPLTGLYNRRGVKELVPEQFSQAQQHNYKVGFLYLDMDNFKAVNDTYGHWMGDRVLKEFADIMLSSVQSGGIAGRFGGDEFIIVVPLDKCSLEDVKILIDEQLQQSSLVQSLAPITVGYSVGEVIWSPGDSNDLESLISNADHKMYAQKQKRRAARNGGRSIEQRP